MKKIFSVIFLIVAILTLSVFADEVKPVTVTLNGEVIDCASYGQEAEIVNGRTMVPLRAIFESLGASVEWEQSTKTVTSTRGETTIRLTIGENKLYRNSECIEIDVPAQIMNGRTMVPARAVAESFGVSVGWSAQKKTVVLMTVPNVPVAKYNADIENRLAKYVPKSALDSEILCTIGGIPVSATAVRYRTMMLEQYLVYGLSEEDVLDLVGDPCKQNAALIAFAYGNNITLTDEEIKTIVEATLANLETFYGDGLDAAFAASPYTKHYYCLNAIYSTLYSKVADKFLGNADGEYMQSCLADAMANEDLLRAKHILIQFPENEDGSEATEEQKIATLEEAIAVFKEVKAMADISEFDALVDKYNDDPGMVDNKVGYYFGSGEMVEEFENATRELEIGKTSGIVETAFGYHIILRLPIEEDSFKGSNKHIEYANDKLLELIDAKLAEEKYIFAGNYEERIGDFKEESYELY